MRRVITILALSACSCIGFGADLGERLAAAVNSKPAAFGNAGIHVIDATTGEPLYGLNEDRLYVPASNAKLFTSALALEKLGADYRFTTRVLLAPTGDLVLVGGGDPSLSGRVYPYSNDKKEAPLKRDAAPLDPIADLAEQIVKRGMVRIDGDVIGDDGLYPWAPYPQSWSVDDTENEFGAPVSALTLNDNTVAISISPGQRAGDHASLALSPPIEFLTIDHRVVTGARGSSPAIRARRLPGSRQWIVTGGIPLGHAAVAKELPVDDPAAFAAAALYDALVKRGVAIRGRPVARHRAPETEYLAPEGSEVASRQSPPLGELLRVMEKVSQNLHAELILREVGRVSHREATSDAGVAELGAFVKLLEASFEKSTLAEAGALGTLDDGSGLGRNTLVAPRLITQLLAREYASPDRDLWVSLLPAGGEDGTLEHRLCCVGDGGGIRAKTGTLSRAVALSGYAFSKTSGTLAFSIVVNDFSARPAEVRAWIDKIALALLE
jgi:D-alanyl-D-alanine carboxypeptidase/D-alanyl-D-alanine-endopeptidase (penicillin-binding protein 4)